MYMYKDKFNKTDIDVAYSIFPRLNDGVTIISPSQLETPLDPAVSVMPPLSVFNRTNELMSSKMIRFVMSISISC